MIRPCVSLGVASRAHHGHALSGDAFVARPLAYGFLLAVADGLGHGEEAAFAARLGLEALGSCDRGTLVSAVVQSHRRLQGTRGAAMSVALLDAREDCLTWIGVGNVQGAIWRTEPEPKRHVTPLVVHSGVVGLRLPQLVGDTLALRAGDVLVVTTDGIRLGFHVDLQRTAQEIADTILARYAKGDDDALVLAARYIGTGG